MNVVDLLGTILFGDACSLAWKYAETLTLKEAITKAATEIGESEGFSEEQISLLSYEIATEA